MPDKKLTDNEIIKALEWLESKTKEYCEQCAYKNSEVCDICIFDKIKLALDLINRQKAEINRKEKVFIETLRRCALKDEIISEKTAEIEKLKIEKDNLIKIYAECQVANLKEFVKRLETLKQFRSCILGSDYELSVTMREIDNTYKEMVGEDK